MILLLVAVLTDIVSLISALSTFEQLLETPKRDRQHKIPEMFQEAMMKYRGAVDTKVLLGRTDPTERKARMEAFRKSVEIIDKINDDHSVEYSTAINFLSVMLDSERSALLSTAPNVTNYYRSELGRRDSIPSLQQSTPESVDWVAAGAQPPVKDQLECGSGWAFSTVSALDSAYFILTGELVRFSEQELLDCVWVEPSLVQPEYSGTNGCHLGYVDMALAYVKNTARLAREDDYPYRAEQGWCDKSEMSNSFTKADITVLYHSSEEGGLERAVSTGVMSVSIQVRNSPWSFYRQGIFECSGSCSCQESVDHAVTVVGYTPQYWNVRNSWGKDWGDGGYIKMTRKQHNICLINSRIVGPKLTCKAGATCTRYDEEGKITPPTPKKEETNDKDFYFGEVVETGEIVHKDGKCLDMDNSAEKLAVISTSGCSREFSLTDVGYIVDMVTKLCLSVDKPDLLGEQRIRYEQCSKAVTWERTGSGFALAGKTLLFWHSHHTPSSGDKCEANSCSFSFDKSQCWEVMSGFKMTMSHEIWISTQIPVNSGLEEAKDACIGHPKCTGIYLRDDIALLSDDRAPKPTGDNKDKVAVRVACENACEVGKMRCLNGLCERYCGGQEVCPPGLVMCPDGHCLKESWC